MTRRGATPLSAPVRRARRRRAALALPVAGALLLAACGSDDDTSGDTTSTTSAAGDITTTENTCVADIPAVIETELAEEATTASLPDDLVAALDEAAATSFTQAAAPGAIVGVRTPEGTWIESYGEADPDADVPMTTDLHQRIGSVTKTFTGTVIMQLAEDGELSLDDPISDYVDDVPNGDEITLRLLADMTSGVNSYTADTQFTDRYFADPSLVFTPEELVAIGVAGSPIFEPGAEFNYSNTNTVLLGLVIEEVTGQDIATVFEERVFEPLGLDRTSWPGDSPEIPEPYSQGFTLQGDTATPDAPANATNWNPSWTFTAGALISDVDDLLIYGRALATGQGLLSPSSQTERLESLPAPAGYGIALGCIEGWVGHTGELPGYNTTLYHDTSSDTTVVVAVNSDIASGDCAESPTLNGDPRNEPCSGPATRMFVAVSTALGNTFQARPSN